MDCRQSRAKGEPFKPENHSPDTSVMAMVFLASTSLVTGGCNCCNRLAIRHRSSAALHRNRTKL